jgi:hypothetical protein
LPEQPLTPEQRAQRLTQRLANLPAWYDFVSRRPLLAIRYTKQRQAQRALRGMAAQVR